MALLNNPEACAKIAALYAQVKDVYEEDRLHYRTMCCDLCGAQKCVRQVMGFAHEVAPKLCVYHGAAWNAAYTLYRDGQTPEYCFAKWLAAQVMKEAKKRKGETHDN